MLCESSVGTVSANKAAAMHSEDVEVASACAPLRGYTMHVWHPSQQGGGSSDCTVAAKKKDTKHRHNDMCTKSDTTGHALSHRRTCCIVRLGRLCVRLCNRSCTHHLVASHLAVWCEEQQLSCELQDVMGRGRRGECDMWPAMITAHNEPVWKKGSKTLPL